MQYINQWNLKGALWGGVAGDYFAQNPHHSLFLNNDLNSFSIGLEMAFVAIRTIIHNSSIDIHKLLLNWHNNHYFFNNLNHSQRAIALIPLILYCHENSYKLETYLQQLTTELQINNFNYQNIFDITLIFQLILQNQDNLIANQLLLNNNEKLSKIFSLCQEKKSIKDIEKNIEKIYHPGERAIYQAIYSFISLPNYVELSLLRSTHFDHQKQLTAILTGCLLGFQNKYYSLPLSWRKYLQLIPLIKDQKIDEISQKFIEHWQGKYIKNPLLQT